MGSAVDKILPLTTWYFRMLPNATGSVGAVMAEKAALVGAKTVKGPVPFSVVVNPAVLIALTRLVKPLLVATFITVLGAGAGVSLFLQEAVRNRAADKTATDKLLVVDSLFFMSFLFYNTRRCGTEMQRR